MRIKLSTFTKNASGNVALIMAILLPIIIGLIGGGIDYYTYSKQMRELQEVSDAAALAAAREAAMQGWDNEIATSIAQGIIQINLADEKDRDFTADIVVDADAGRVEVIVHQDHFKYFLLGYFNKSPQIAVNSIAMATGRTSNTCIIGLHEDSGSTIGLENDSTITAPECAIYSNSLHRHGITATGQARITSQLTCSAGGYRGTGRNFRTHDGRMSSPAVPVTDCPVLQDPLANRLPPRPSSRCLETALLMTTGRHVLRPGTYCDGLGITGNAEVTFLPGTYVIQDGPMIVSGNADVSGIDVSFYYTGENAIFEYVDKSIVSFEAPRTGPMAGLLIMQDPRAPYYDDGDNSDFGSGWNGSPSNILSDYVTHCLDRHGTQSAQQCSTQHATNRGITIPSDYQPSDLPSGPNLVDVESRPFNWSEWPSDLNDFRITSDFAQNLLGTVYLPNADLVVDARRDVAAESDYTAIVLQRLILKDGPNLILNAAYDRTSVPVPEGLGPVSADVRITE